MNLSKDDLMIIRTALKISRGQGPKTLLDQREWERAGQLLQKICDSITEGGDENEG